MLLLTPRGSHYTRCPLLNYPLRVTVWLWVWAWACVALSAGQRVGVDTGTILQDFPIAAEENFYSFNPDGTYTFSYDTGGGEHQSFRIEMRDASGRVSGRYGYVDPAGALRITEYQADSSGYRASIEVYHQVSLAPPAPLLVGPLPKQPTSIPDLPEDPPQPPAMRPIGPAPFFPPQQPVLIIGPLPRPLQPQSNEDDQDPPDLNEDSLFTIPSNPLVPAILPQSPLRDDSSRDILNSLQRTEGINILQGTLTDIPQQSSDEVSPNTSTVTDILPVSNDDDVSENNTVTSSNTSAENTDQHNESLDAVLRNTGQTVASSNAHADQQLPDEPQLLLTQNNSPVTIHEQKDINPSTTKVDNISTNYMPGVTVHAMQDSHDNNSTSEEPNYTIQSDLLQPSTTSIITSTLSSLPERGRGSKTETTTAITSLPVVVEKENEDTRGQSRKFRKPYPVPPIPPLTYLPVGVPHHLYPTAPLLQLRQKPNRYSA